MSPQQTQNAIRLKVAEMRQNDVGKGIVRLGPESMRALGLERGDVVEVEGKHLTAATVVPVEQEDVGLEIVRLDGLTRHNVGVGIGEHVEIREAEWSPAARVVVAPAQKGLRVAGTGEALRPTLLHRPVLSGDLVSTSVFRRPRQSVGTDGYRDDFFRDFFESPAFGLMEIRLTVVSTKPRGVVRVTPETEIELAPEYTEVREDEGHVITYDDIGGLDHAVAKVREMIELPLRHPELFDRLGIEPPLGVLLHGPPGTGKTLLARAVAHETDSYFAVVNGPEIMGKHYGESEERLRQVFEEAEKNAPAIIFIDELDSIAPKRGDVSGETERRIVAQLLTLMDGLKARRNVVVIGATNRIDAVDEALRRPGRFDREIVAGIPDQDGRFQILQIHTRGMPLHEDVDLEGIAARTHGYTGSDLSALARESAVETLRRMLPELDLEQNTIPSEKLEQLEVTNADVDEAFKEIQPSALREVMVEIPRVTWEDVGGLENVKRALSEMVELPLQDPGAFLRLGIRAPKGILLYGPPGTGKTLVAKAVANQAGANFLAARGSSLLSKWYGESEKKIAELFQRARHVAPAVIFFDELDSLAPVRGGSLGEPAVTERVVNQILSELDGVEELQGVCILGATNRPDRVDPALLRPGRLDEMVYVPMPDAEQRRKIFEAQLRGMHVGDDVDLDDLTTRTARFSGADIAGVCTRAGMLALRTDPRAERVGHEEFLAAIEETVPSVTAETEAQYEQMAKRLKQDTLRIGFER
ncbi:MAG TPA: CDC48 family AAA ATPase [Candidatus Krumholzibacteria bacterium]|nr:CDC48 family AAA ATPase [Candidatus Krumholzibacteria bacterium]